MICNIERVVLPELRSRLRSGRAKESGKSRGPFSSKGCSRARDQTEIPLNKGGYRTINLLCRDR